MPTKECVSHIDIDDVEIERSGKHVIIKTVDFEVEINLSVSNHSRTSQSQHDIRINTTNCPDMVIVERGTKIPGLKRYFIERRTKVD